MTLMILNKFKTLYFQNVLLRNMGSLIYLNKKNIIKPYQVYQLRSQILFKPNMSYLIHYSIATVRQAGRSSTTTHHSTSFF